MIIKTKNLVLRPYRKEDAKALFENFNDFDVTKFLCGAKYPFSLNDSKKWIKFCHKTARQNPRKEIIFAIEKNKLFVGSISLKKIKKHKAELGFWIGRRYWNQGIMTEALHAVADFGFDKLKLERLYGYVFLKNKVSAKVFEKCRFKREGLLRRDRVKNGKLIDVYVYARLK